MTDATATLTPEQAATVPEAGLLVVGGRQAAPASMRELGPGWYGYAEGIVASIDATEARVRLQYVSPPEVRGADDAVLFKSATRVGNLLYATTQTEVLVLDLPSFEVLNHVSHPWFNDVHHVVPTANNTLLVASSGLEVVLEVSLDGEVVGEYPVDDIGPRHLDSPDVDYRLGVNLKPHRVHPNHLFHIGDEPWVTRFEARDAVSLVDRTRRIAIDRELVHDGHVHDGSIWFTTVDGTVITADSDTLEITAEHDLTAHSPNVVAGWCRGLFVTADHVWVGFTRVRHTAVRSRLSFIRNGLSKSLPTRVECWRRDTWTLESAINLEPIGINAVFTITRGLA